MLPENVFLNGILCRLDIRHNACKNIIVRIPYRDVIRLSVPARMNADAVRMWLDDQHLLLSRLHQRSKEYPSEQECKALPPKVSYQGETLPVQIDPAVSRPSFDGQSFRLPENPPSVQKQQIAALLLAQAQNLLLPRLHELSAQIRLYPDAVRLTHAKGFWGVCRNRRIALNWRLIGAPEWVIDYVCIHELCHVREANHSKAFWGLVRQHYHHVVEAKKWLQQHRAELFRYG